MYAMAASRDRIAKRVMGYVEWPPVCVCVYVCVGVCMYVYVCMPWPREGIGLLRG